MSTPILVYPAPDPLGADLLPLSEAPAGNQQLGLHVTEDELAIWQNRTTDNVNSIGGVTYQTMWGTITSSASNFTSATVGNWDPGPGTGGTWDGSTNFPDNRVPEQDGSHSPGLDQGIAMLNAAFVALVSNDSTYGNRVKTFLLNHAGRSTLDFSNTTAWAITNIDSVLAGNNVGGGVAPFLTKCLFAYDYIRAAGFITGSDRTTVETWLNDAGTWLMNKMDYQISQNIFPNRLSDDYSACTGGQCDSSSNGRLYYGGPLTYWQTEAWSNRLFSALVFVGAVANPIDPVITWNSNFSARAKRLVKEFLQYSVWSTGSPHDMYRWGDGGTADQAVASSWTHSSYQWGPPITVADHMARAGDTELYDYSTTNGFDGMTGGSPVSGQSGTAKTLLLVAQRFADMALGNVTVYGSNSSETAPYIIRPTVEGGHSEDYVMAMGNLYWQDATIKSAYTATRSATSGCGGWHCSGPPWGEFPHLLFMFGDNEGIVDPY